MTYRGACLRMCGYALALYMMLVWILDDPVIDRGSFLTGLSCGFMSTLLVLLSVYDFHQAAFGVDKNDGHRTNRIL